jgi:hypothetical protein
MLAVATPTAAQQLAQVWKFQAHPEVWVLMVGLVIGFFQGCKQNDE